MNLFEAVVHDGVHHRRPDVHHRQSTAETVEHCTTHRMHAPVNRTSQLHTSSGRESFGPPSRRRHCRLLDGLSVVFRPSVHFSERVVRTYLSVTTVNEETQLQKIKIGDKVPQFYVKTRNSFEVKCKHKSPYTKCKSTAAKPLD